MKIATIVALVLGGVPLLVYPIVLLADVMSLAGDSRGGSGSMLLNAVVHAFIYGTLAYPVVYLACAVAAIATLRTGGNRTAFWLGMGPIGYLLVMIGLMAAWSALG